MPPMEPWRQWQIMAQESEKAARAAEAEGCLRSAASRYYYAAYQAATALLVYRGLTPPQDRQAWPHDLTPDLVVEQLEPLLRSRDRRNDMARRLRELYKRRVVADYVASA